MTEDPETERGRTEIDRRRFLRHLETGAVVAGAALVLPSVASGNVAFAAGSGATTTTTSTTTTTLPPVAPNWTLQTPTSSPAARQGAPMATGPNGTTVLFGGYNGSVLGDTWVWNGTTWTQQTPTTNPPARANASMATGTAGTTVLFGGVGNSGYLGDTWVWGAE